MSSSGKSDDLKGRLKEATGSLLDDDDLKNEGAIDRAAGKVKEAAENVVEKAKDKVKDLLQKDD
jgi:uncharacterized protein YjbJ (UPF0337 family)